MAVNVFELMATIGIQDKEYQEGLKRAEESTNRTGGRIQSTMGRVGGALKTAGTAVLGVTGVLAGLAGGAVAMGKNVGDAADRLLDLEQISGLNTDTLQEFAGVARVAGVDSEALASAATGLTRRLREGSEESATLEGALGALGVSVRDQEGQLRSMDDLMPEVINNLQGMENTTARNSIAFQLFGGRAEELIPVLSLTAEQFDNARQEARDMGQVLDKDALNAANNFRVGIENAQAQLGIIGRDIIIELLPILNTFVEFFQENMPLIREIISQVVQVVSVLFREILIPAFEAVQPIIEDVLLPVIKLLVENGLGVLIDVVQAIIALFRGDFEGAFRSLASALQNLLQLMVGLMGELGQIIIDGLVAIPRRMLQIGQDIVQGLIDGIRSMFGRVGDTITGLGDRVVGGFKNILGIESPSKVFRQFGMDIGEGLIDGIESSERRVGTAVDGLGDAAALAFSGSGAFTPENVVPRAKAGQTSRERFEQLKDALERAQRSAMNLFFPRFLRNIAQFQADAIRDALEEVGRQINAEVRDERGFLRNPALDRLQEDRPGTSTNTLVQETQNALAIRDAADLLNTRFSRLEFARVRR